ncbi:MAG: glycosyltransferase family 39 protein [Anaerolineae bacterium]|nr:glycosyltransferase family 39 protein [Anaerolineae bacterium]
MAEQPQPPGYILYVALCRLVNLLFDDPQTTMVVVALGASGLAAAAMYFLGRATFDRRTGISGAMLLVSSPLFWFYGEIALPHTVDAFLVILCVWWLYEAFRGSAAALLGAAIALALAGGMRQQTPVFLSGLTLLAGFLFLRSRGWKRSGWGWSVVAGVTFAILCAAWLVPLIHLAGGMDRYRQISAAYLGRYDETTSLLQGGGLWGLTRNLRKLGMYVLFGWGAGLLPLCVGSLAWLKRRTPIRWSKVVFLTAWVLPSLLFYAIIHMGQQGLVFIFLPALLLLSARGLVYLTEGKRDAIWMAALTVLVLLNASVFLFGPEYPLPGGVIRLLTQDTLRHNDTYFSERVLAVREGFSPSHTVIVAANWRHVEWYLPDYALIRFTINPKWELEAGEPAQTREAEQTFTAESLRLEPDDAGDVIVVVFDDVLTQFVTAPETARSATLPSESRLHYFTLRAGERLVRESGTLRVVQP